MDQGRKYDWTLEELGGICCPERPGRVGWLARMVLAVLRELFATANLHLPIQCLVHTKKLRATNLVIFRLCRAGAMQDLGDGLLRERAYFPDVG
jgi:hypothetical protein